MMPPTKNLVLRLHGACRQLLTAERSLGKQLCDLGSLWCFALLMVNTLCLVGCGGSGDGLAPVHGVVTLDGKPLTEGFVLVTPAEGKMAKGTIQADGAFVLGTDTNSDGVKIGTHPVSVIPPPAQEGMPISTTAKSLPQRYTNARTSGITVDVKPDADNELTLELFTHQQ
ncbi:hypothetical protein [Bythopirellula polymerisocia]|uniref:Carboxypeptidase regulatory-like domain-containing protein n=1 Tax=Bythopirellula polymerisocia TaxID=2528003 RepID=A0A5C6D197_9BACT|nr:hypothetical protein [Bythopirellula polymerisocia]TWU28669.1 hypothetical protein Pla144_19610 [Bythopirellula polymerisocia]